VVQPIVVRKGEEFAQTGRYTLITGERRWLASKKAGKATIPSIVREVSNLQAMEMTIVENLQRADLNPMEQAHAFNRLSRDFNMTQEQMAERTGKDRASIGNFLRLLRLPMINPEKSAQATKAAAAVDPNVREAEDQLRRALGLKVTIEDRKGKGKVIIEYSGVADFDAILTALGQPPQ